MKGGESGNLVSCLPEIFVNLVKSKEIGGTVSTGCFYAIQL